LINFDKKEAQKSFEYILKTNQQEIPFSLENVEIVLKAK